MNLLTEAKLTDLVLDLHSTYGGASPRPNRSLINFTVVATNTTYTNAKNELEALLDIYGVLAIDLSITPGPEVKMKINRLIKFSVAQSTVLGGL